ncbi:unnamed protein product [Diamesa hyperborea]
MGDSGKLKETFEVEKQFGAFYTGGTVRWTSEGNQFLCRNESKINVISMETLEVERTIAATGEETSSDDIIYTFILSSGDQLLVTAHRSGLLKLWDFATGEVQKSWKSLHQGPISYLDYCENTDLVASGGSDSSVRIWDFKNQSCRGTLRGGQGVVSVIKFHPGAFSNTVLAAADDANILAWNYETREVTKKFAGHISKVTSISFHKSQKYFVSSSRDKVLILWDYENEKQMRTIPVYEGIESSLVLPYGLVLPNGIKLDDESKVYVACAGEEGVVKVWLANESKLLFKQTNSIISKSAEDGGLAITQMFWNEKVSQIALVSSDHNIIVHDLATFSCKKQLIGFTDEILDLVLLGKKNQYLAMATNSNDIKVYDLETMNSKILRGHTDIVLALSQYKNYLLSSGKDYSIRLWKIDYDNFSFECIGVGTKHTGAVGSVDFSKVSGSFFASVSQDQCLKLWKLPKVIEGTAENPENLNCINTQLAHEKDINCVCISPNDRYIATSSQDKTAKLWDSIDLKLMGVFRGHRRGVWSIRFSPVDQIVVTNAADCTIRLWNITDMTCLKSFEGHESSVLRAEFISNGMQLLSAGADGLMKLWNIKTSECVQTLDKHENRIWTMAITNDETVFYSGGSDSQLIKWKDVTDEKKLEVIQKRQDEVIQEQELNNLISQKQMLKALRLALNLNRPHMTLKIINSVIKTQESGLDVTIFSLNDEHKQSLLNHAVNWNTNSRNCRPAQLVFDIMLQDILAGKFQVQGLNKTIEDAMPYTDRHFKRMTEYMKDLKFIEYTMHNMLPYGTAGDAIMK